MLRNGNIDFAAIPSGKIKETVEEYGQSEDGFTSTPGKQVLLDTELSTYFLIPSPADPVMTDVKVRRAVSMAINRQSIVDALFEGSRMPATSIMPTSIDDSPENTWEDCKYDPEVDQAMLDVRQIAVVAIVIEAVAGIGAGIVSVIKRYSFWDILVTLTTSMLVAMPAFWPGLLLQLVFGIWLKDLTGGVFALPVSGMPGPRPQFPGWTYYILPAITPAAVSTAYTARAMRSELARSLGSAKAPASGEFFTLAPCAYREATFGWPFCYRG